MGQKRLCPKVFSTQSPKLVSTYYNHDDDSVFQNSGDAYNLIYIFNFKLPFECVLFMNFLLFQWWRGQRGYVGSRKMVTISHICYTSLHTPLVNTYIWALLPKRRLFTLQEMFRNRRSVRINFFFSFFFAAHRSVDLTSNQTEQQYNYYGSITLEIYIIGAKCIICI